MPIRFSCFHCKKTLQVKDELGGRKVLCPGCKKVIAVPAQTATPTPTAPPDPKTKPTRGTKPKSKPQVDIEALAAEMLEEKKVEVAAPTFVDHTCPYCDAEVKFATDLAGKQAPCPECRRIVRVPQLAKTEPRDWRQSNQQTLPSGAKRDDATPEGAWGTETSKASVSRQALVDAAVIKQERPKVTVRQWIVRGVLAAGGASVVIGAVWFFLSHRTRSLEERAAGVVEAAAVDTKSKLTMEQRTVLEALLGEYHTATGKLDKNERPLGGEHVKLALLSSEQLAPSSGDRVVALQQFLKVLVRLEASADQVARALALLPPGLYRENALRDLIRLDLSRPVADAEKLSNRWVGIVQQGIPAVTVQQPMGAGPARPGGADTDSTDQANSLGIVGQEMRRAGFTTQAQQVAKLAREVSKPELRYPWQVQALLVSLDMAALPETSDRESMAAGRALGLAQAEKLAAAETLMDEVFKSSTSHVHLDAELALADALLQQGKKEEAARHLATAIELLKSFPGLMDPEREWTVQLTAAARGLEEAEKLVPDLLAGPAQGRARLTLLEHRLGQQAALQASPDLLSDFEEGSCCHAIGTALLARHNARQDAATAMSWVESLPEEPGQAFGAVGVALGMRDQIKR